MTSKKVPVASHLILGPSGPPLPRTSRSPKPDRNRLGGAESRSRPHYLEVKVERRKRTPTERTNVGYVRHGVYETVGSSSSAETQRVPEAWRSTNKQKKAADALKTPDDVSDVSGFRLGLLFSIFIILITGLVFFMGTATAFMREHLQATEQRIRWLERE